MTEFFKSLDLYSRDGLEMGVHSTLTMDGETTWPLLGSSQIELFESVEFYLEDDLEMAGCSVVTLGRKTCTVTG